MCVNLFDLASDSVIIVNITEFDSTLNFVHYCFGVILFGQPSPSLLIVVDNLTLKKNNNAKSIES